MELIITGMILTGGILMIYNIYAFAKFAAYVRGLDEKWYENPGLLYFPIALLVIFLIGYFAVGLFGNPDLMTAVILFGGSIFVFVMHVMLRRITEQVVKSEESKRNLLAAKESDRMKMDILSTISHEMRTPLNIILGLDHILLKRSDFSDENRTHLYRIHYSASHLLSLVNNMLDMNRIETGTLLTKKEPFCLKEVLDQLNVIAEALCLEKGLQFRVEQDDTGNDRFLGDEAQLRQVLLCIIDNAVKYTDVPGTVLFRSWKERKTDTEWLFRFSVEDTGIGIDSAFIPKLFDAFSREDSSNTSRFGGSGLSLAVSQKMVRGMGGSIEVQSEKNNGSVFTVRLPLQHIQEAEQPVTEAAEETVSLENKRILIVEDIPENAEIAADLLELEGAVTEHAENGKLGLEFFSSHPAFYYDAILMDLRMPVMDGLECTKQIRSLDRPDAKTVPIIALTANSFQKDVDAAMESGMNAHLAKPADADLLYSTVKKCLGKGEQSL